MQAFAGRIWQACKPRTLPMRSERYRFGNMIPSVICAMPDSRRPLDATGSGIRFHHRRRRLSYLGQARKAPATQAEPDSNRDLDFQLLHSRWKGRQLRTAHHLIDALIEVGIAAARQQGVVDDAAKAVDLEAQCHGALLTAPTGGDGITLMALEPGADHRPVAPVGGGGVVWAPRRPLAARCQRNDSQIKSGQCNLSRRWPLV